MQTKEWITENMLISPFYKYIRGLPGCKNKEKCRGCDSKHLDKIVEDVTTRKARKPITKKAKNVM